MSDQTTAPHATTPAVAPAPALDYLRTGRYHATTGEAGEPDEHDAARAERLAEVIEALSRPAPAFMADVPTEDATPGDLAPADHALNTDLWPNGETLPRLLARLRAFAASEGAVDLFGYFGAFPCRSYGAPALGWRPGETAESLAELGRTRERLGKPTPEAAEVGKGFARYTCALTGKGFALPLGAPVPCLTLPLGERALADPLALPPRSKDRPGEYVDALDATPHRLDVHPALVEAGPAYVLRAAWQRVEDDLFSLTEKLDDVLDRAAAFAGLEPSDLPAEWPSRAYRKWTRQRHDGGAKTWERELVGFRSE
ncbi:hypothetical protein [Rubrivirga sp.]|uniref:hypothetical protein n=1 Tax=Rubrivirga sp. TaxID=1885344 RepID=UPI003B52024D